MTNEDPTPLPPGAATIIAAVEWWNGLPWGTWKMKVILWSITIAVWATVILLSL